MNVDPVSDTGGIRFETPRLLLREHAVSDLAPLHAILNDPAVVWYLPDLCMSEPGDTQAYLESVMRDRLFEHRERCNLAVERRATGELIGSVGFHVIDRQENSAHYGLGFFMRSDLWNMGYTSEAVRAALSILFSGDGFRVTASCLGENLGSRRVLEKCGFSQEGLMAEHTLHNGQWKDCALYGILKKEWQDNRVSKDDA